MFPPDFINGSSPVEHGMPCYAQVNKTNARSLATAEVLVEHAVAQECDIKPGMWTQQFPIRRNFMVNINM